MAKVQMKVNKEIYMGKQIAKTHIGDNYLVSTVLLPPIMRPHREERFETCIFNQYWEPGDTFDASRVVGQYNTEEEAVRGHAVACETLAFVTWEEEE